MTLVDLFYPCRDQPSCNGWTKIFQGSAERLGTSPESAMSIPWQVLAVLYTPVPSPLPCLMCPWHSQSCRYMRSLCIWGFGPANPPFCFFPDHQYIPGCMWWPSRLQLTFMVTNLYQLWQRELCIWVDKEAETLKSTRGELNSPLNGWHMFLAAPRLPVPGLETNSWVTLAVQQGRTKPQKLQPVLRICKWITW